MGFRDPNGIRPLVIGKLETKKGTEWMLASESVALDMLGFDMVRDVAPGEAVVAGGHARTERTGGGGGARAPAWLYGPHGVTAGMAGLEIVKAPRVVRPVQTGAGEKTAIDVLVRATRTSART